MNNYNSLVNKKILVIDDDVENQLLIKTYLKFNNYEILSAYNGNDGIVSASANLPDIILLDVNMPNMNGYEVIRLLKANEKTKEIPVIFITASDDMKSVINSFRSGGVDYIGKPFSGEELLSRIKLHLELQKYKKENKDRAEKYSSIVELAHEGIWVIDDNEKTNYLNNKMAEILGYTAEEMMGKQFFDFMDARGIEISKNQIKKSKQGIKEQYDFEFINNQKKRIYAIVSASPIIDRENKYIGTIMLVTDITERKQKEQQLIYLERLSAVGQLTSGVAHEFNNMLSIIMGNIQVAECEIKENNITEIKNNLAVIKDTVNKASNIVFQMMTFARTSSYDKIKCNIASIIEEVVEMQKKQLELENIKVIFNHKTAVKVFIDKTQIFQVFLNILINSRHSLKIKGKGTIEIKISKIDEKVRIDIIDDGSGMDAETKNKIFTPFFTTKGAFSKKDMNGIRGTGLGLAVCYSVIKNHEGVIFFESELGKGTTFTIILPSCGEADSEGEENIDDNFKKSYKNKDLKILIIDDEKEILKVTLKLLNKFGYSNVDIAESGMEAMKQMLINNKKYKIVFLDMMMPDMNGQEVLKKIKEIDEDIKVVFMSGNLEINENVAKNMGGDGFIMKPYNICDFEKKIEEIII